MVLLPFTYTAPEEEVILELEETKTPAQELL